MRLYRDQPGGTVDRARELRRSASEPERRLWRVLRETFPHLKWRRQVPLGPYYADVLCISERMVIEVDGDTHADSAGYDERRTGYMVREGYRVTRFSNIDVMKNLGGVISQISFYLREKEAVRAATPCGTDEGGHRDGTAA